MTNARQIKERKRPHPNTNPNTFDEGVLRIDRKTSGFFKRLNKEKL